MKVNLKSNFDLGMESIDLEGSAVTLRHLLTELAERNRGSVKFIDPRTNEVDDFFAVSINGQEYQFLPQRLETPLKSGDEVQIAIISFGGG